jgi:adenosine kinase
MVFHDPSRTISCPTHPHPERVLPGAGRAEYESAGNIASLKKLGGEPVIMATVGDDFGPTATVSPAGRGARHPPHRQPTAQAFIATDLDDSKSPRFIAP